MVPFPCERTRGGSSHPRLLDLQKIRGNDESWKSKPRRARWLKTASSRNFATPVPNLSYYEFSNGRGGKDGFIREGIDDLAGNASSLHRGWMEISVATMCCREMIRWGYFFFKGVSRLIRVILSRFFVRIDYII